MAMAPKFGPPRGIDSKDYHLKMQEPGQPITQALQDIFGHSLTSPGQNLTDPVSFTDVEMIDGVVQTVSYIKRAAQETSRTYTVGLPSAIWTPVIEASLRKGCVTTFFMIYLCPEDPIYAHWYVLPDATLNPPVPAEDFITITEDTNIITQTTELQTPKQLTGYGLSWGRIFDVGGTIAYNDIVFTTALCAGCSGMPAQGMLAVGGDGTAVPTHTLTTNRFATTTALTSGQAATAKGQAVYTSGDYILVSYFITATTGAMRYSFDKGVTWSVVAGVGVVIHDIIDVNGVLIAIGGDTTAGAKIYISTDRTTFVQYTNALLPTVTALRRAAYDKVTGRIYIAGDAAKLFSARLNGSTLLLSDLSSLLDGSPGDLRAVCVRAKNEIVVGGSAGYMRQSRDGGQTWVVLPIATTAQIAAVDGNLWRLVVGAGSAIFEQTALTNYDVKAVTQVAGSALTGVITRIRMNLQDDFNRYVVVTDAGEVAMGLPYYPGA